LSLPNKLTPAGFPGARVGLETTFFAVDAEEIAARVEDVIHPEPS
jgi:hypothetical protein